MLRKSRQFLFGTLLAVAGAGLMGCASDGGSAGIERPQAFTGADDTPGSTGSYSPGASMRARPHGLGGKTIHQR